MSGQSKVADSTVAAAANDRAPTANSAPVRRANGAVLGVSVEGRVAPAVVGTAWLVIVSSFRGGWSSRSSSGVGGAGAGRYGRPDPVGGASGQGWRLVQPVTGVDTAQWLGRPPVVLAEQPHRGRDEERPNQRGVDDDGNGQPDAQLLDGEHLTGSEAGEDDDDEGSRRGDDASGTLQSHGDRQVVVARLVVHLLDAGQQEDLVVHGQAEGKDQDEDW